MPMAVDTLAMAQAMRRSGLPQEQAEAIAEQIGKAVRSRRLATKEFVGAEITCLRADLRKEMDAPHSAPCEPTRPEPAELFDSVTLGMAMMVLGQALLIIALVKL